MFKFKTKDSGERTTFETGAQKEPADLGKGRYDLLSTRALRREASWAFMNSPHELDEMSVECLIANIIECVVTYLETGCVRGDDVLYEDVLAAIRFYAGVIMELEELGERVTGDTSEETGHSFECLSPLAIHREAQLYERGAVKYADRNWEKGIPLSRLINSLLHHAFQYKNNETDEDHLAAIRWNAAALIDHEERIQEGLLPESLDDLPKGSDDHEEEDDIPVFFLDDDVEGDLDRAEAGPIPTRRSLKKSKARSKPTSKSR